MDNCFVKVTKILLIYYTLKSFVKRICHVKSCWWKGVYFAFLYESALRTFYVLTVWVCNFFWQNEIGLKAAHKLLVKSTLGCSSSLSAVKTSSVEVVVVYRVVSHFVTIFVLAWKFRKFETSKPRTNLTKFCLYSFNLLMR